MKGKRYSLAQRIVFWGFMVILFLFLSLFVRSVEGVIYPFDDYNFYSSRSIWNVELVNGSNASFSGFLTVGGENVCLENGTYCVAGGGSGDITAVYTNGNYLTGGSASGDVSLLLDESVLNATIDDRDSDTTYGAGGSLLGLSGTTFSVGEGTLTDSKWCKYSAGTGLVCDVEPVVDTDTTYSAGTGLSLAGTSFSVDSTSYSNWNTAYGWGDHSVAGYLTSYTETDPKWSSNYSGYNKANWDTAYGWGNHASAGYLTSESDPLALLTADTDNVKDTHVDWGEGAGQVSASDVPVLFIAGSTYDSVQDFVMTVQSAGKVSGGGFSDNGDGSLTVAAGTGFIKTTDSDVGISKFFDWAQDVSVSLTDNSANYVYVDYNGGSPSIAVSTTAPTDHHTKILLGMVFREGTDLHEVSAGQLVSDFAERVFWKSINVYGKFQRASGLATSETGTRNLGVTAGVVYAGLTKVSLSSLDTSGTDSFVYYYRDGSGSWTAQTGQTAISNQYYDDGSGSLATLDSGSGWRPADYGVHWVYEDIDGDLFVVYGQGSYTLTEAQEAGVPSSLPSLITEVGGLIAKVIIQKDASSFYSVQSAFDNYFVPAGVYDHNSLSGLQGGVADEYYHLNSSMYDVANRKATGSVDGFLSSADWNTFNNKADSDTTYSAGNGISLSGTTFAVAGNTCLSQDADGLSVTADCIGDSQLAYNTGQHLTTTSVVKFAGVNVTNHNVTNVSCVVFSGGGSICDSSS